MTSLISSTELDSDICELEDGWGPGWRDDPLKRKAIDSLIEAQRAVEAFEQVAAQRAKNLVSPVQSVDQTLPAPSAPCRGEPDPALIESMCYRYDHGHGIKRDFPAETDEQFARRQESTRSIMRQLWEEVVGRGFYRPNGRRVSSDDHSPTLGATRAEQKQAVDSLVRDLKSGAAFGIPQDTPVARARKAGL